ncbi:hypothetical protein [Microbispora sp. GKU 823]|uniref:hypothetical protein n=1 Tax=Microbispora sp. GKU 823 TaxID=1652100 RepID=UPI0009A40E93|nr:hypothetical protein [Microbispora sp. GKU 823]OPG13879.1 hypothetical protein B1L11_05030 [Microbispora sp. GKU 823]
MGDLTPPIYKPCPFWCTNGGNPAEHTHSLNLDTVSSSGLTVEVNVQQPNGGEPRIRVFVTENNDPSRYVDMTPAAAAAFGQILAGLEFRDLPYLGVLLTRGANMLGGGR